MQEVHPELVRASGGVNESGAPRIPRVAPRFLSASLASSTVMTLNLLDGMSRRALVVLMTGCRVSLIETYRAPLCLPMMSLSSPHLVGRLPLNQPKASEPTTSTMDRAIPPMIAFIG